MTKSILAPIIFFVYNRPYHTKRSIEALNKNHLSTESTIYIYSDGEKNKEELKKINEVRSYVKSIKGFKKINIINRHRNYGVADSIIDGVTSVVNKYGKAIILEDDIVTSPYFLKFMNDALKYYEDEKKVMHISGWTYPIKFNEEKNTFLWRVMNCWGWGTWKDRWSLYRRDPEYIYRTYDDNMIKSFDLENSKIFWPQIIDNKNKRIKTWAIFWYASIFSNRGLCLNPTKTYVLNIGQDGTGTHCGARKTLYREKILNNKSNTSFPNTLSESSDAIERVKKYYKKNNHLYQPVFLYKIKIFFKFFIKKILSKTSPWYGRMS